MWISVKKRLPGSAHDKLVTTQDMYGVRWVGVGYWHSGRWVHNLDGTVIAWAPLPRAYRGTK